MTSAKLTQYLIDEKNPNVGYILNHYNVTESDLYRVFNAFEDYVVGLGIPVEIQNLSTVSDSGEENTDHAETCTSDGKTVYLHNQLKDHGGILTRIYDIMHLGCGHVLQRGANETSGLTRYGDKAREIGSVFHEGANAERLQQVEAYELEAGRLGLAHLKHIILSSLALDTPTDHIIQMYNDYVLTDKQYIIDYYKTGISTNFFSNRKYDQPLVFTDDLDIPVSGFIPKQRGKIEIGLIRSDD